MAQPSGSQSPAGDSLPPLPAGYREPPPPPGYLPPGAKLVSTPTEAFAPRDYHALPPTAAIRPETVPAPEEPAVVPRRSGWGRVFGFGCLAVVLAVGAAGAAFWPNLRSALQKTPLPETQAAYVGQWTGADGSTLAIRADGSGDVRAGGVEIENGQVTVDEVGRTVQLDLLWMQKSWRVDETPSAGRMRLDGMEFTNAAASRGAPPPSTANAPVGTNTRPGQPLVSGSLSGVLSPAAAATLAQGSLAEFRNAVRSEDFTAFHASASSNLRTQHTPESMKTAFDAFVKNKPLLDAIGALPPRVAKSGLTAEGILEITGDYPSNPPLHFTVRYLKQGGTWTLLGIQVTRKY